MTSDSSQIHDLLAQLAHLADEGDIGDYLQLFADDAVWEMPENPAIGAPADRRTGREEIAAGVMQRRSSGLQGPGTGTRHVVTTVEVQFESPDRANAVAYWMFYRNTSGAPQLMSMGRYDDVLLHTPNGWRLAHRRIRVG